MNPNPATPTRRRFLHGSILTGAAMSLNSIAPSVRAETDTTSDRLALLADPHIDADPATRSRQDVCMADNLAKVVNEVIALREHVDAVVINGDCAYIEGLRGDYETLANLLHGVREAGLPIHMTLGNHDDRGPFYEIFPQHAATAPAVNDKHVAIIQGRHVNWFLLDSLNVVNETEGEVGARQLEWLDRCLTDHPDKTAIVVGHHYPEKERRDVVPADPAPAIPGLSDGDALLAILHRHPHAQAYIYGHSHVWGVHTDDHGLHHINLPPTSYTFSPGLASGWVLATVHPDHMTLELRTIDRQHPQHGDKTTLRWRA